MKTSFICCCLFASSLIISCTNKIKTPPNEGSKTVDNHVEFTRRAINPENDWGAGFEMNQAEVVSGFNEMITFSGQTALVVDSTAEMGLSVKYPNDQRKQMEFILNSIDYLLKQGGMERKDILHINFFTTDMEGFLANYDVYASWIKAANIRPTQSAIGVSQLVSPEMKIEIEVTGAR